MSDDSLTFFHAPNTRSFGTAVLLEELAAPHQLHVLNMKAGEQRKPAFLAVNPMGKVPAIMHRGALVSEQAAVFIYLADLFPAAGLAPSLGDQDRGPYLRWMAFYGSSFEPALIDKAMQREPAPRATSPYGSYETVLDILTAQLRATPFIAGARITAADILWGIALRWTTRFKLIPDLPEITAYIDKIASRPSVSKIDAMDARLAAEQDAALPTSTT